jgi:glucosylceramidase
LFLIWNNAFFYDPFFRFSMIDVYLSAKASCARLTRQASLSPCAEYSKTLPSVWVDETVQFQTMQGFGGAFTEASAVTWLKLDTAARKALLEAYFSQDTGHGYTFCRVHMNSCDFSLGNYSHVEQAQDIELSSFNIKRDEQALLPFIQAALAVAQQAIKLLASPWSPPAWMKSNGQMNHGGKLLPQYRAAWAQCYVKFIQAYEARGVPIWGVSVQNEPDAVQVWDSCIYSAEEERDFIRDHLGPALANAGLSRIHIVLWDHNRDLMVERASIAYGDPKAAEYIWGTGFHWYGEDHFDHVQRTHDAWPSKQLLFTEGCQEGGAHLGSWALGERYARSMIQDINHWTVGWIDWNLLLNEQGGPNHVGNLCSAPMMVDTTLATPETMVQSSYYYLGHFARFVKHGAKRVLCSASQQDLEVTAFLNLDGTIVAVVMNRTETLIEFNLKLGAQRYKAGLPARSIATYLTQR